jgi:hypothetical protein
MTINDFAVTIGQPLEDCVLTQWNGEPGFEWVDRQAAGNPFVQWFPTEGWSVGTGRGTVGRAASYQDAIAQENAAYDAAYLEFIK